MISESHQQKIKLVLFPLLDFFFKDIIKEDKKKAKKLESEKKEKVKIPGTRLIESIKRDRSDLIVKPNKIKIDFDGKGRSEQIKEKREKLQKLKDLLKELKENS